MSLIRHVFSNIKNVANAIINPSTEEKQDNIITELSTLNSVDFSTETTLQNIKNNQINGTQYTSIYSPNGVNTDIKTTAWGIPIFCLDYSIFHSLFTYNINTNFWKGYEDGVENLNIPSSTRIISTNGELELKTTALNGTNTELVSLRSPRYQPNRGHKYSTTIFSSDIGNSGTLFRFGLGTISSGEIVDGIYFEIENSDIYIVARTQNITRQRTNITVSLLNETGLTVNDLKKGHLYDIQFQWRGVGNYFFYIDLKLVGTLLFLGTLDDVTISNPQLPAFYQVKNITAGEVVELRSGCIDITSEGGQRGNLTDASKSNNGIVTLPNDILKHPALLIRIPMTFKGKINTRNSRLLRITGTPFVKDMRMGFAITRDTTAIGGTLGSTAFQSINTNSSLEYVDYSVNTETEVNFDFTKAGISYQATSQSGRTISSNEPNADLDLYFSAGDIICLFSQNIKSGAGGEFEGLLEFGEEI